MTCGTWVDMFPVSRSEDYPCVWKTMEITNIIEIVACFGRNLHQSAWNRRLLPLLISIGSHIPLPICHLSTTAVNMRKYVVKITLSLVLNIWKSTWTNFLFLLFFRKRCSCENDRSESSIGLQIFGIRLRRQQQDNHAKIDNSDICSFVCSFDYHLLGMTMRS